MALPIAERICIRTAMSGISGIMDDKRATSKKSGAPGGCGTWRVNAAAQNSPTSQKTTVGEIVLKYVASDTTKTAMPTIRFSFFVSILTSVELAGDKRAGKRLLSMYQEMARTARIPGGTQCS